MNFLKPLELSVGSDGDESSGAYAPPGLTGRMQERTFQVGGSSLNVKIRVI